MGRPSLYTEELATEICAGLISGKSLRTVCKQPGIPTLTTVCRWIATPDHPFRAHYDEARTAQYEAMETEIVELADGAHHEADGEALDDDGNPVRLMYDSSAIQRDKLRATTRLQVLERIRKGKWSKSTSFELPADANGVSGIRIEIVKDKAPGAEAEDPSA